ncbi:hypothetical protein C2845_PM05G37510 [Panicum miliaceum]|uniref:Uncharacterized protein n=1 Tax=Panicum miliaceum TaxID=4540 RepID=A0A3L6SYA3_PANMI|nr:hypothetical protein C2845_PM05G37510 [Panicum miliaceum]
MQQGITLLLINLSNTTGYNVTLQNDINVSLDKRPDLEKRSSFTQRLRKAVSWLGSKPSSDTKKREEYHLTAKDGNLQSKTMLLNGVPLELGDDGSVPAMNPVLVAVDSSLSSTNIHRLCSFTLSDAARTCDGCLPRPSHGEVFEWQVRRSSRPASSSAAATQEELEAGGSSKDRAREGQRACDAASHQIIELLNPLPFPPRRLLRPKQGRGGGETSGYGGRIRGDTTHYDAVANSAASGVLNAGLSAGTLYNPSLFASIVSSYPSHLHSLVGGVAGLPLAVEACQPGPHHLCMSHGAIKISHIRAAGRTSSAVLQSGRSPIPFDDSGRVRRALTPLAVDPRIQKGLLPSHP